MKSYPFTSQVTYDMQGLPKYDRAVNSEFLRAVYAQFFSDGVFYDQSDRLQVVADTGMQVKVNPGSIHIRGAIGIEETERTLQVQAADTLDRIDTVVARLDLSLEARDIDLYVVKGAPAESPQPPVLTRDATVWEEGLANLFIAKNTSTIPQERITDTRLDPSRCGQVGAAVQPPFDTAAYFAQLEAAIKAHQGDAEAQIEQLRKAIAAVEGDTAWMMQDLYDPQGRRQDIFSLTDRALIGITVELPTSGWTGDEAPYSQTVAVDGVTADRTFSPPTSGDNSQGVVAVSEALGLLCGVESAEGAVTVYASEKPEIDLSVILRG